MAEVLEIQVKDQGGPNPAGPPRPPSATAPAPATPAGPLPPTVTYTPAAPPSQTGALPATPGKETSTSPSFLRSLLDFFEKQLPHQLAQLGSAERVGGLLREFGFSKLRGLLPGAGRTESRSKVTEGAPTGPLAATKGDANVVGLLQAQLTVQEDIRDRLGAFGPAQGPRLPAGEGAGGAGAEAEAGAGEAAAVGGEAAAAEEGVGGLMAALGGAEAGLSALGPVGIAVGVVLGGAAIGAAAAIKTFEVATHLATDEIRVFGLKLSSSMDNLAAFNPQLAMAQANSEIRELFDDMKEAQEVGPDLARIADAQAEAQHQLREIWLPIKKVLTEVVADVLEKIVDWLKDARVMMTKEFWEEFTKDMLEAAKAVFMGGISFEDAWSKIMKKMDDIKEQMEKEDKKYDTEMWLANLYNTPFDIGPSGERLLPKGGGAFDRPNIPIVNAFGGL